MKPRGACFFLPRFFVFADRRIACFLLMVGDATDWPAFACPLFCLACPAMAETAHVRSAQVSRSTEGEASDAFLLRNGFGISEELSFFFVGHHSQPSSALHLVIARRTCLKDFDQSEKCKTMKGLID